MQQGKTHILFIDDDKVDQMAFKRYAEETGFPYDYTIAGSVAEARSILEKEPITAVLTDYMLGDGNAFELFEQFSQLPVVMITGTGNEETAVKAIKNGAADYLIKDQYGGHLKTLLVTLEKAILQKQNEAELKQHRIHLEQLVEQRTRDLNHEIEEHKRAEKVILRSLKEKELMLKEIHHRVKNNLQIVVSLLNLQANVLEDPNAIQALQNCRRRVLSMAVVHQRLYQSHDFALISVEDYIRPIATEVLEAFSMRDRIELNLELERISMGIDIAIPCGLIVNELMTNTLQHAFEVSKPGQITVSIVGKGEDTVELIVKDNGRGISDEAVSEKDNRSLGLNLVRLLTDQLRGTLSIDRNHGTCVTIRFPFRFEEMLE